MKKLCAIVIGMLTALCPAAQEDYDLAHVIEDIYTTVLEETANADFETIHEELLQLSERKININQATPDDLRQLYFLSDEKIEKVLIYRDQHPFHSVYELQLVPGLREWEYRFLALFVEAGETEKRKVYAG